MADNKLLEQTKGFYGKLSNIQKILIASVFVAIIGGLITIISLSGSKSEWTALYRDLEQNDAAKIVEILKERNVDYKLEDNGSTILVDKESVYDTRLDLANEGLPESGVPGYEIFDRTNLGMSEFVQKLNYRRALEGELAKTIATLDDVKKVRVHIVIPEKTLFKKDQKEPTASVSLHLKNSRDIGKASIEGIQNLVASSVEGMTTDNVIVVDHRGKILSEATIDQNSLAGLTAAQHEQQAIVEEYLASKVQSMLDGVLGYGNSEVRVNAELDFTKIEKTITDFDPDRQVTRSEQQMLEKSESTDSLSYPAVNMAKDESNTISNYEISKTVQSIVEEVGNIKRLSVATVINGTNKVVGKDGLKEIQYVPRSSEEMEKLTLIVKNSVGYDPSRNDQISVITVPFDTMIDEDQLKELNPPKWYEHPDNIKLFLLIGSMIVVIFLLYSILRSKAVRERIRIAMELPEHVQLASDELDEAVEDQDDMLEELDLDDDDLLMLPGELPDQLMLEGDGRSSLEISDMDDLSEGGISKNALAEQARAQLENQEDMTEERMMRLEMKSKVQEYVDQQPADAAKLVKMFIMQDIDNAFK